MDDWTYEPATEPAAGLDTEQLHQNLAWRLAQDQRAARIRDAAAHHDEVARWEPAPVVDLDQQVPDPPPTQQGTGLLGPAW